MPPPAFSNEDLDLLLAHAAKPPPPSDSDLDALMGMPPTSTPPPVVETPNNATNYWQDVVRALGKGVTGIADTRQTVMDAGKWVGDKRIGSLSESAKEAGEPLDLRKMGFADTLLMGYNAMNKGIRELPKPSQVLEENIPSLFKYETSDDYRPAWLPFKTGAEVGVGGFRKLADRTFRATPDVWASLGAMGGKLYDEVNNSKWAETVGGLFGGTAGGIATGKQAAPDAQQRVEKFVQSTVNEGAPTPANTGSFAGDAPLVDPNARPPLSPRAEAITDELRQRRTEKGSVAEITDDSSVAAMQKYLMQNQTPNIRDDFDALSQARLDQIGGDVRKQFDWDDPDFTKPKAAAQAKTDALRNYVETKTGDRIARDKERIEAVTQESANQAANISREQAAALRNLDETAVTTKRDNQRLADIKAKNAEGTFHQQTFNPAIPERANVDLKGKTPFEAVEILKREVWGEQAFPQVKGREFDIDPEEVIGKIVARNDRPGLDQHTEQIVAQLEKSLTGKVPTSGGGGVLMPDGRGGFVAPPAVSSGRISGEDLMQARNDFRMNINTRATSGSGATIQELEALRRAADEIDSLLISQLDNKKVLPSGLTEQGEFLNELEAYGNWVAVRGAVYDASDKEGGVFSPEQYIGRQKKGPTGPTTTGTATGQQEGIGLNRSRAQIKAEQDAANAGVDTKTSQSKLDVRGKATAEKLALGKQTTETKRPLQAALDASKTRKAGLVKRLDNSVLNEYAKNVKTTATRMINNPESIPDFKKLHQKMVKLGTDKEFNADIRERVLAVLTPQVGKKTTASIKSMDDFEAIRPQLVGAEILTGEEADRIAEVLKRTESQETIKGARAVKPERLSDEGANLQASAASAALLSAAGSHHSLMVGGALRRAIRAYIGKNPNPDPKVIERLAEVLKDPKQFEAALKAKAPEKAVYDLALQRMIIASKLDDEEEEK